MGRHASRADVKALQELGVEPTVGQAVGGTLGKLEEMAISTPIVGQAVDRARERALEQFNVGVMNQAVKDVGGLVTESGPGGIVQMQSAVDDAYDQAARLAKGIVMDPQGEADVFAMRTLGVDAMDAETAGDFKRFMEGVWDKKVGRDGSMDRDTFQYLDRKINEKVRNSVGEKKQVFQELLDTLRGTAQRQNPEYAEAYQKARTVAAKAMRVEEAATAAARKAGEPGLFTGGQLIGASKKMEGGRKARRIAANKGLLQKEGTAAQAVLGNSVPNSGTAERLLTTAGLGGLGGVGLMADPVLTGILGAGVYGLSRTYDPVVQRALVKAIQKGAGAKAGARSGAALGTLAPELEYLTGGGF
jgi:hypothetical protein